MNTTTKNALNNSNLKSKENGEKRDQRFGKTKGV